MDNFHPRSDGKNGGYFSSCKLCENKKSRAKYWKRIDHQRERGRKKNQAYKRAAMAAYGDACACCGETELAFLSIDHIENDGAAHRKQLTSGFYPWLKLNGYPEGYQVLCYNCNWAKSRVGGCPHQRKG